jgi:wyosine [tRNA(Phe)-imidazoG37] synthetase (radical SAM superfamily)
MSKIIFGPITSRRFGQSLGIDLSPSQKQCNFDCVYCELKGAKPVDKIQNPPRVQEVIAQLKEALIKYPKLDVITFTANGEPTLYPYLNELINEVDKIKKEVKTLILSNASNIHIKSIVEALKKIDIVKLSLDCVSPRCFKKIDRPLNKIDIEKIIEGMIAFRKIYYRQFVLEILVVKDINDKEEEFFAIKEALKDIKPDRIDIGTIDRPPAYKVKGVSIERLQELAHILEGFPVSIAYKKDYTTVLRDFSEEEILELLAKRPQSSEDVRVSFSQNAKKILDVLLEEKKIFRKEIAGVIFFKIANGS